MNILNFYKKVCLGMNEKTYWINIKISKTTCNR